MGPKVVPKRRYEITTTRCVMNQKSAVLAKYFFSFILSCSGLWHPIYWHTVSCFEVFHSPHFHILRVDISSTAPTKFPQINQPRHTNIAKTGHGVFLRNLHPTDPSKNGSTLNSYCHNPVQCTTGTASIIWSTLNSYCHNPVQSNTCTDTINRIF